MVTQRVRRTTERWRILPLLLIMLLSAGCSGSVDAPQPSDATNPSTRGSTSSSPEPMSASELGDLPELDAAGLERLSDVRIFFAHRSVGGNIIEDGLPAVYTSLGMEPPVVVDGVPVEKGSFGDHWLEQTEDPETKLRDFDRWIRLEGVGATADIAFMKLGFVDIVADTDVPQVFEDYRAMMARLTADYPDVIFLHVTVSPTGWQPENNAAIERFNQLMRQEYGSTGRFFDLARTLATCSDGSYELRESEEGNAFHDICPEYTNDGGHLNEDGARLAATQLLRLLVSVTR